MIGPERSSSLRDEGSDRVRHRRHPAGFESDINADELFNMFFGGNGQFARPGLEGTLAVILASGLNPIFFLSFFFFLLFLAGAQFQTFTFGGPPRRARAANANRPADSMPAWVQFIPLLLVIWFLLFSSPWFQSPPIYSMQKSSPYLHEKFTQVNNVPYYVKADFAPTVREALIIIVARLLLTFLAPCFLGSRKIEGTTRSGGLLLFVPSSTMQLGAMVAQGFLHGMRAIEKLATKCVTTGDFVPSPPSFFFFPCILKHSGLN